MARPISKVDLTEPERKELEGRVKASTASQRDSLRAAIILRRAEGIKQAQVARELGVSVACVNKVVATLRTRRFGRVAGCEGPRATALSSLR